MRKLIFLFIFLAFTVSSFAQAKFTGLWEGKLNVGPGLRLFFSIEEVGGKYSAKLIVPDQSKDPLDCADLEVRGDSLIIRIEQVKGGYAGLLVAPGSIKGSWSQAGRSAPLDLKKVDKIELADRPQTPKAPFPYKSEDIIYHNKTKSIQYGATITIPQGKGPFPAIIMSTGSGPQNRDEEIYRHKPFAVIADYLTRKGYIVLRVDDQGMGKTTGNAATATTADFAKDVLVGIDYLKSRPEVDKRKIGVMGHSEGGLIAEMVAATSTDVNFIVLLAGPGINIINLMEEQNAMVLQQSGISKEAVDAYLPLYNDIAMIIVNAAGRTEAEKQIGAAISSWKAKVHPNVTIPFGLNTEDGVKKTVNEFAALLDAPWWRYFMGEEPKNYLEKLNCKVLALNGDKDIQVISESNLAGVKEALAKSRSPKYDVHEMKGLNHLFQKCLTCSSTEYGDLDETFSPDALKVIGDWLDANVK
ncbi:MAG TPA: acyl-CoA thioester hydrolase/BAAT C-terminal domain-containing protein [Flavipsychrobacter sp.]|nr:acyl-CoA thioester hydrolase/BAAT C-terminal domain-containing protein [Flavipsychrobacter sp.]